MGQLFHHLVTQFSSYMVKFKCHFTCKGESRKMYEINMLEKIDTVNILGLILHVVL